MVHTKFFSLFVILICVICSCFLRMNQKLHNAAENNKCPFCCGITFCDILKEKQIKLDGTYFLRNTINTFFSNKSVLFARWRSKSVVLKPLESFNLLTRFHKLVDEQKLISTFVDVDTVKNSIQNVLHASLIDHLPQKIQLCPNADHIDFLIDPTLVEENTLAPKLKEESTINRLHKYINIWTLLKINAEPIIQKALKGWPVATYLGCCGQTIVSENCGEMLTDYAKTADWSTRVKLSQQLLRAALRFTFGHPNFSFYFTDISADNIAVSEKGILKFVDVENVIIVDKNPTETPRNWNNTHRSKIFEAGVFTFSPEEICSHHTSDHNLYAVCQEILGKTSPLIAGGLLNSPPQKLEHKLNTLLHKCIEGTDRFEAASELLHTLQTET